MKLPIKQSALFFAAYFCIAIPASWGAEYKIAHKVKSMNIEFAYTEAAEANAKKDGKTLQDAINKTSPFLFLTLLQATKGGQAFQGYIINRVYDGAGNAVDVVAVMSKGQVIDVSDSQNPVVQTFFENLKNAKLSTDDSGALEVSPSQDKVVKVALKKK
jgi:hypothetical protein